MLRDIKRDEEMSKYQSHTHKKKPEKAKSKIILLNSI